METQTKDTMTFQEKMNSIRNHYKTYPSTRYAMPYTWCLDSDASVRPKTERVSLATNDEIPLDGLDYKAISIISGIQDDQVYHQQRLQDETKVNAEELNAGGITEDEFKRRMKERREQSHDAVDKAFDALENHGLNNPSQQYAILTAVDAIYNFFAKLWAKIAEFFNQVWDWIKNIYYTVRDFFTGTINSIKSWFGF
ncbi:MAG: hypothetical protein JGK03_14815 [Microcoleus sp. PH2017_25_DOB_D_A]|uniref:hypothetical protein n=1 Tax=unclassified Microcoleus TaxID=2642155 RepID=UPI001E0207A8|nr:MULTISPECIES: hypothetical protein [unclassified Microcoleus]MCC3490633.1 hypothetical protein [Microcoleus sp. PH2017_16_JOR_D_A]MCC3535448.1 hypothetical protein [Microcoleus sp. PH2017_25_DOB_D_A]MCC3547610.1 hypothetical protein [Microcoleus sp. PH2017_24_DOB_U_A]